MRSAVKEYARRKALLADSTIIYLRNKELIEENPRTFQKVVLFKHQLEKTDANTINGSM